MEQPIYMLAADHRWQWDEWCDRKGVARSRIVEAKGVALDGLLAACNRDADVRDHAAFLIDRQYGSTELSRAAASGVAVGTPAEKPGVFPLEWTADPFWSALSGTFAKVLIRHRPEWAADVHAGQVAKLRALADWCAAERVPLVLEVVIPRTDEPEDAFEATGRPALLASVIHRAYEAGVVPDYWKIEGTPTADAMRVIDAAVAARPGCRLLILGKGAGFDVIDRWFHAAAAASTAAGFAIGRSVYWEPAAEFLLGLTTRATAVDQVAANYLRVVDSWRSATRHTQ